MNKVSLIVPVYNGEAGLKACVESLLAQSHEDLEILLIDDGSKDASLCLCQELAKQDGRIRVLHHENHGVSYTRNRGLKEFSGDWAAFADCDDTVEPDYVKAMLEGALAHGTQAAQCTCRELDSAGNRLVRKRYDSRPISSEEALFITGDYFMGSVWCKLYSRSLLREGEPLWFDEDIRIGEDHLFWCRAVRKAGRIYAHAEPLYNYLLNESGATASLHFESAYTDFVARGRTLPLFQDTPSLLSIHLADRVRIAEQTLLLFRKGDDRAKKAELKRYIRQNRKAILQSPHFSRGEKLKVLFINFAPFRAYWRRRQAGKEAL